MSQSRPLITEKQVIEALQRGETILHVEGNPIITPLAASTLSEHRMVIESTESAGGAWLPPRERARAPELDVKGYDARFLLELYATMQRIRGFETAVGLLFHQERLLGFVHLSIGQEAVPAGTCAALQKDDYLTLTHRGHGQMIARGARLDQMMAELYGKATGYCKGKGGSVHLADFQRGILGANGIVGASIVIATGAAMSAKIRGTKQVAVAFFGDGAVNQGAFHESLNIASVEQLPILFICENNQYAVSMAERKAVAAKSIADRGRAYEMPGVQVDGQDVVVIHQAVKEAVERARQGGGPSIIECLTYRFRGHWEGETLDLRPKQEREEWEKRDPIQRLGRAMVTERLVTEEQLQKLCTQICDEVVEAVRFAESSPYPPRSEALKDVLSNQFPVQ